MGPGRGCGTVCPCPLAKCISGAALSCPLDRHLTTPLPLTGCSMLLLWKGSRQHIDFPSVSLLPSLSGQWDVVWYIHTSLSALQDTLGPFIIIAQAFLSSLLGFGRCVFPFFSLFLSFLLSVEFIQQAKLNSGGLYGQIWVLIHIKDLLKRQVRNREFHCRF